MSRAPQRYARTQDGKLPPRCLTLSQLDVSVDRLELIRGPPGLPMCARRCFGSSRPLTVISKFVISEPFTVCEIDVRRRSRRVNSTMTLPFTVVELHVGVGVDAAHAARGRCR